MLARLLQAKSPLDNTPDIEGLVTMLGRAYGLRDDYKNLSSDEVNPPPTVTLLYKSLPGCSTPKPKAFARISTRENTLSP